MNAITGQLQPSDTSEQRFATLADEGGVNATLWFGQESLVLQVTTTGQAVLVYDDGRGGARKPVFMGFMWEIAKMTAFAQTERDGILTVEAAESHTHEWHPAGFTPHPASGGLMATDRCACGAVRYPYSPEVK